jgi:hypothetical protein
VKKQVLKEIFGMPVMRNKYGGFNCNRVIYGYALLVKRNVSIPDFKKAHFVN